MSTTAFELLPGKGLGDVRLMSTLYQTVKILKAAGIGDLKFIYSTTQVIIVLQLSKYDINFLFDCSFQRLMMIEVNPNKSWTPKYMGKTVPSFDFKPVYNRIFGPTFPGYYDSKTHDYYLSYSGIAFKYSLDGLSGLPGVDGDDGGSLIQQMSKLDTAIPCSSIVIFHGSSWLEASGRISKCLEKETWPRFGRIFGKGEAPVVSKPKKSGSKKSQSPPPFDIASIFPAKRDSRITIIDADIHLNTGSIELSFLTHPWAQKYMLSIGSKLQDVIHTLGPPEESFGKVHNYFGLGLDIVYTGSVVSKLIAHTNEVNALEFLRYDRLHATLNDPSYVGTTSSSYSVLKLESSKPVFLDRKEYELDPDNISSDNAFEMVNGTDEEPLSEERKKWGVTTLYKVGRAIFEVIVDGDRLSRVTIF